MPAAGSSSSSNAGFAASARANSSRRCSPKARLAASSSRLWARSKNSSVRSISSRVRRDPPSQRRRKCTCARCSPEFWATQRFCQTVSWPNRRMFWKVRAMPCVTRSCGDMSEMSAARNRTRPAVSGNRPQIRLTIVLLPDPFGPIRPKISPAATERSTPSTARTPPKCFVSPLSSSTGLFLAAEKQPLESDDCAGIEQTARADVHRKHDQAAKQQIAPVAHETQAFDQETLNEDNGDKRSEHVRKAAEDRIGDSERREHHTELD